MEATEPIQGELGRRARVFIGAIVALGLAVLIYSFFSSLRGADFTWIYLAVLSGVSGCFPVQISKSAELSSLWMSAGDVFVFSAILFFGPEVAALVAAADGVAFNLRKRVACPKKILFNVAQIGAAAFLAGHVFYLLRGNVGSVADAAANTPALLIGQIVICSAYHFVLTTGLVARVVSYVDHRPFDRIWKRSLPQVSVSLMGAVLSAVLLLYSV